MKKRLKFTSNAIYNNEVYASAGEVKDVPTENGFADRWIRRGAQEVKDEPKKKIEATKPTPVKEEVKVETASANVEPKVLENAPTKQEEDLDDSFLNLPVVEENVAKSSEVKKNKEKTKNKSK